MFRSSVLSLLCLCLVFARLCPFSVSCVQAKEHAFARTRQLSCTGTCWSINSDHGVSRGPHFARFFAQRIEKDRWRCCFVALVRLFPFLLQPHFTFRHFAFDSTLGFPGEGPGDPPVWTLISANIGSLNTATHWRAWNAQAICLQELVLARTVFVPPPRWLNSTDIVFSMGNSCQGFSQPMVSNERPMVGLLFLHQGSSVVISCRPTMFPGCFRSCINPNESMQLGFKCLRL